MKQFVFSAIVSLVLATEAEAEAEELRAALMKHAPFSHQKIEHIPVSIEAQSKDSGIERQKPDFAAPENKGKERKEIEPKIRKGDELILKSVRNAKKAERDEKLAGEYKTIPFHMNESDKEPVYPDGKEKLFLSPVFLVDPMFTKKQKDEDIQVFRDNDFAGFKQPRVQSKFPIVRKEVQSFFDIDDTCTCRGRKRILAKEPQYLPMRLPRSYGRVLEPQYGEGQKPPVGLNGHTCFRGDDYGGHNIPFPHPEPPKPDKYYDDCYVDLGKLAPGIQAGKVNMLTHGHAAIVRKNKVEAITVVKEVPVVKKVAPVLKKAEPETIIVCRDGKCREEVLHIVDVKNDIAPEPAISYARQSKVVSRGGYGRGGYGRAEIGRADIGRGSLGYGRDLYADADLGLGYGRGLYADADLGYGLGQLGRGTAGLGLGRVGRIGRKSGYGSSQKKQYAVKSYGDGYEAREYGGYEDAAILDDGYGRGGIIYEDDLHILDDRQIGSPYGRQSFKKPTRSKVGSFLDGDELAKSYARW